MLRSLVFWLLLTGLGLVAWEAAGGRPAEGPSPQTLAPEGGTGWPTPPVAVPTPPPSPGI